MNEVCNRRGMRLAMVLIVALGSGCLAPPVTSVSDALSTGDEDLDDAPDSPHALPDDEEEEPDAAPPDGDQARQTDGG